jgi:cation:H+ antiporter
MRVPKMLVALTIAAFGTCAPELAISFTSIATKNVDMTLANVIGSCIVNILLIVGVATIVKPIEVKEQTVKRELPLLVLVSAAFFFVLNDSIFFGRNNGLGRWDAVVLLALFGLFMLYIFFAVHVKKVRRGRLPKTKYTTGYSLIYIVLSLITIALAANIAVDNAVAVAGQIGISQKIIAMTAIVIGTSLPELTMTVGASRKGEFDLAVGNIIGTNIFNICIVLGLPTLIFGGFESEAFGIIDTLVVLAAAVTYYVFGRSNKRLTRKEGIFMVMLFTAYYTFVLLG